MSSLWSAMDIAGTGLNVNQTWIDAIGSNIANMNDVVTPGQPAYQSQFVHEGEKFDSTGPSGKAVAAGVQVDSVDLGSAQGQLQYDPTNPLANDKGMVEYPVVDLATQMTGLIQAQTSYQANVKVLATARDTYASILNIKA